ncbi:MAG TPA: hypothetical protein VGJ82_00330 [Thermoanaerobaculia bacterium]
MLGRRLEPWVFRVVDELNDELTENPGTLPPSALFSVRVMRAIVKHSTHAMVRNTFHALSLARLATLLAPHLPARTPYEGQRALFLEGEAYRHYACALHRAGRNFDAQRAAEEARRFFRIPVVRKAHPKYEWILDLTSGQIVFHLEDPERGLEIISRAADHLHVVYGDVLRFLKGRIIYATLLMSLDRYEDALAIFDEALDIASETNNLELRAVIVYNISICGKRLQKEKADECNETALPMLKKTGISADTPRAGWTRIIELQQTGKTKSAISEMYAFRQGYIDAGLELQGHVDVTPVIVEALVREGRSSEARMVGEHAILKLAEAGLKVMELRIRKMLEVAPPPSDDGAVFEDGA